MPNTTPLDSLVDFARGARDDALVQLAASLAESRALEERLALLISYRDEYALRLASCAREGLSAQQLRGFGLFLDKLDLAIRQQRQAVRAQTEQHIENRSKLGESEAKFQGYASLRERRRSAHTLQLRREEQRASDEHASRAARHSESTLGRE